MGVDIMQLPDIVVEKLDEISRFRIYFGKPIKEMKEQSIEGDMLIVNPYLFTREQVLDLQKNGVTLIGSINILEMPYRSQFEPEDYYKEDGERIYMLDTDSYVMNLTSHHYRYILTKEITEQIIKKGFNGVLFIGEIHELWSSNKKEQQNQMIGLLSLIKKMKNRYKMLPIFLQWNPEDKNISQLYVDGLVWEYFNFEELVEHPRELDAVKRLQKVKKEKYIIVCTVSVNDNEKNREFTKRMGFLYYHEKNNFKKW